MQHRFAPVGCNEKGARRPQNTLLEGMKAI
ncbi:hypothetical protein F0726_01121 [Acidithiobacillus caldus]|nr:hypothetical protein F0726_01121 [Acidithiobacillus caldus]